MSKLEELIEKLCPNGVEYKKLDEVCNFNRGTSMTSKNAIEGDVPVISGGQKPAFYHNVSNRPAGTITIAGSGAYAGYVAFWDKPIFCADSFSVDVKDDKILDKKFLCYYLLNKQQDIYNKKNGAGIAHVHGKDIAKFNIPVPPLEVQCEIVHILDDFTLLSAELSAELKARREQFNYYRDKEMLNAKNVVKYKLNEIAKIYDGTHQTPKYTDSGIDFISVENIKDIYNSKKYISIEDYNKYKIKPKLNDIFMTRIGTIGKCTVFNKQKDLAYYVSLALIRPNNDIVDSYYLKYLIESIIGIKELRKRTLINAVPIKINKDDIGKLVLPIPPLEEQKRIVNILDRFDKLCNDISEGLPAEIEARQKQYEYYRDKLLTFKELKVNE